MNLKVLVPDRVILDEGVTKIIAEAVNGSFCLLPHHLDLVTILVPGILYFTSLSAAEHFIAVDDGILVKCQQEVFVSTLNAVRGDNLENLKETIAKQFRLLDEQEKLTRSALVNFEVNIIRHFQELGKS